MKIIKAKWVKSEYSNCVYSYMKGDTIQAMIFPVENKEGKLNWQYSVNTNSPKMITSDNCKRYSPEYKPYLSRKKEAKDQVEIIIKDLNL